MRSISSNRNRYDCYELFIGFLAIFSLAVMALIFLLPSSSQHREILLALDSVISFIFLFDFFCSLIFAVITITIGVGLFGVLTSYLSAKFIAPHQANE